MNNQRKMNLQHFAMKNLDALKEKKKEIFQKMNKAVTEGNEDDFIQAFNELSETIQEAVTAEARELVQKVDSEILAGRGVRQLTSQEREYYEKVTEAMRSANPKQALTDLDVVLPITTIDLVFEDLQAAHPLLDAIEFMNTSGMIEIFMNTNEKQLATWGALTAEIVTELTSGFKKISASLHKLSAFIPVAKSMLDLGPQWLDRYVRAILMEAIYYGLEEGIINGTGKDMPIGMNRQVGDDVTVTAGVYPLKETVEVNSLDPVTYGNLLSSLAEDANGNARVINEVLLIVNPTDYLQKIMPATTVRSADGNYVNNVFPYPTKVIQSVQVPSGKAIFGLAKRYFMGVGTAKNGKLEYDDSYKFLEDERTYLIKLYGHGEPKDNNAFIYADISGLVPTVQQVYVTNADEFPSAAEEDPTV